MPTKPVQDVLPLALQEDLAETLRDFSAAVWEAVSFGTHVEEWCIDATAQGGDEQVPVMLMLRHGVELLDAVSILIKESCIDPCKLLLRGILEVYLGLEYIMQRDTTRRAMSFMVWHVQQKLGFYLRLDGTTEQGKQFRAELKKGRHGSRMEMPSFPELPKAIENLRTLLERPAYRDAAAEYQRVKAKGKRSNLKWHSLFGGPGDIRKLAEATGHVDLYEIYYRSYSGAVHATDIIQGKLLPGKDGRPDIIQIRTPREAQEVTRDALLFAVMIYRLIIPRYAPERADRFRTWYLREMCSVISALGAGRIINIEAP